MVAATYAPQALVALVVLWNAWSLRATTDAVSYLDDASVHEQMVRFASQAIRNGTAPSLSWFPYLNLGSPHFLHYQGLGATIAGAVGLLSGPDAAFRWSLYLMIVLWPLVVYRSARVFRLPPMAAASSAAIAPYLMSAIGVGYEQKAYLWIGYGLWAQLCASCLLPLAWAWTWRAVMERKYVFRAVLLVSLTAALHFETGYLAVAAALVFPLVTRTDLRTRLVNGGVILGGSLVGTAWVTVPLLAQSRWAALNTALSTTGLVRGYGARRDLLWLVNGSTFDHGRLPVVTIAVAFGIVMTIVNWRRIPVARGLLLLFVLSLLVSFGPTTWGALVVVVPGHADIFFRRFLMGVQLAGILLAGFGIFLGGSRLASLALRSADRLAADAGQRRLFAGFAAFSTVLIAALVVFPGWNQLRTYDAQNAAQIGFQRRAETAAEQQLDPLLSYVKAKGDGRLYAGLPTNWGSSFTIGYVPVFKYAESMDVDEVGYTLRTASLMSQPETTFDDTNLGDYELFGVRYVLLPPSVHPQAWMRRVASSGPYRLFVVPLAHYMESVQIDGTVALGRSDVGPRTVGLLRSNLLAMHLDLQVAWDGAPVGGVRPVGSGTVGHLSRIDTDLVRGRASALVSSPTGTTVLLAASFDPGWKVTVDGRPSPTVELAPAVVGVTVGPGTHAVVFHYQGFTGAVPWFVVSALGVLMIGLWCRRRHGVDRNGSTLSAGDAGAP